MPVLTRKQYEAEKSSLPPKFIPVEEKVSPTGAAKAAPALLTYVMMYPELPRYGVAPSFETGDVIDGILCKYECKGGIVRTQNKNLSDYLLKKGYVLLEIKEYEHEIP